MDGYEVNLVRPHPQIPGREDVDPQIYAKASQWVSRNRNAGSNYHNLHQALFERTNALTLSAASGVLPALHCHAGSGFATIDAQGRILLCEERPDVILGSLKDWNWDLRALLKDAEVIEKVRQFKQGCFCRSDCVIRYNLTRAPKQYPALAGDLMRMTFRNLLKNVRS